MLKHATRKYSLHPHVLRAGPALWMTLGVLGLGLCGHASAADDAPLARAKEMLHRTQEALRQAQAENADLARAKSEAESKLQAATQQIDAAKSGKKAVQAARDAKLSAALSAAEATQAETTHKLSEVSNQLAETKASLAETAHRLAAREAEFTELQQSLQQSMAANASCEGKNLALYGYAEAVLQQYKNKSVWTALAQKDPVLGLKNVDIENVVQEYQLKFDSQKIAK